MFRWFYERRLVAKLKAEIRKAGYTDDQIADLWPVATTDAPDGSFLKWLAEHGGEIIQLVLLILQIFNRFEKPGQPR